MNTLLCLLAYTTLNYLSSHNKHHFSLLPPYIYLGDIMIYSPSWTIHLENVGKALDVLQQHKFFAKLSKCAFSPRELEYLGYIVTQEVK